MARLRPLALAIVGSHLTLGALGLAGCATLWKPGTPRPRPAREASPPVKEGVSAPKDAAVPAPPPVLSRQLSATEETRLRQLATKHIEDTERIVQQVDRERLTANQKETFSTVQTFLARAREALVANDVEAAYNLADKARVLTDELGRR
jgi:hypothetical protein